MSSFTLTRAKWRQFKDDNNLSKSSFFKKADVGPHIDSFQKAVAAFKSKPGKKPLESCFMKAVALQKAFEKFISLKEAKAELTPAAKAQLKTWSEQVEQTSKQLASMWKAAKPQLEQLDIKNLDEKFDELGLGHL